MGDSVPDHELLRLSADIVSAHVARNSLAADGLPDLIRSVYAALSQAGAPDQPSALPQQQPAVPIKKSVFPGYLVCLEDGKKLKMLKRHLQSSYGMTPEDYRAKWGLPSNYPMVAPDYAEHRSALAKQIGLGRTPVEAPAEVAVQHIPLGVKSKRPKTKKPELAQQAMDDGST